MSIKTNFQTKTVTTGPIVFSFDNMEILQTMLESTAIEFMDKSEEGKFNQVKNIAEKVGLDIDLDFDSPIEVGANGVKSIAKQEDGESSPTGLTEAEMLAELEG